MNQKHDVVIGLIRRTILESELKALEKNNEALKKGLKNYRGYDSYSDIEKIKKRCPGITNYMIEEALEVKSDSELTRRQTMYKLWEELKELKKLKWVPLSHLMDNDSPYWSGIPDGAVSLGDVVFDWGNPMLECQIMTFKFPGQFGTHIDFPAHFDKNGVFSESFTEKDAAFPLCVIDISQKVKDNPTYCVTVKDIEEYETKYGEIPEGAFVALRTDWSKNWPDMDKMSGTKEDGSENFPGWSLEAIKYIYEERHAAANGHEALDTDGSAECAKHGDLACERYVLESGKIQVEVLCNLDQVPAAGAIAFASWPNFKGANGLPCRIFAICEE